MSPWNRPSAPLPPPIRRGSSLVERLVQLVDQDAESLGPAVDGELDPLRQAGAVVGHHDVVPPIRLQDPSSDSTARRRQASVHQVDLDLAPGQDEGVAVSWDASVIRETIVPPRSPRGARSRPTARTGRRSRSRRRHRRRRTACRRSRRLGRSGRGRRHTYRRGSASPCLASGRSVARRPSVMLQSIGPIGEEALVPFRLGGVERTGSASRGGVPTWPAVGRVRALDRLRRDGSLDQGGELPNLTARPFSGTLLK